MMAKFVVEIKTDNSAFEENPNAEIAHCLTNVINRLARDYKAGPIYDSNGNNVGKWGYDG